MRSRLHIISALVALLSLGLLPSACNQDSGDDGDSAGADFSGPRCDELSLQDAVNQIGTMGAYSPTGVQRNQVVPGEGREVPMFQYKDPDGRVKWATCQGVIGPDFPLHRPAGSNGNTFEATDFMLDFGGRPVMLVKIHVVSPRAHAVSDTVMSLPQGKDLFNYEQDPRSAFANNGAPQDPYNMKILFGRNGTILGATVVPGRADRRDVVSFGDFNAAEPDFEIHIMPTDQNKDITLTSIADTQDEPGKVLVTLPGATGTTVDFVNDSPFTVDLNGLAGVSPQHGQLGAKQPNKESDRLAVQVTNGATLDLSPFPGHTMHVKLVGN